LLGAFGVLQTRVGQAWLAETVAQTVNSPDFAVSVEGLHGIVPFHFTIDRIDIADRYGTYITLHDFRLDISAAALLAGRLEIRVVELCRNRNGAIVYRAFDNTA
jgi:translocation and assembly module TamB